MANNKLKGLNPQQELLLHAVDQLCKSAVVDGHGRIMSQSAMDLFYAMNIGLDDKPYHKREMQDMKDTIMKLHYRSMVDEDVPSCHIMNMARGFICRLAQINTTEGLS